MSSNRHENFLFYLFVYLIIDFIIKLHFYRSVLLLFWFLTWLLHCNFTKLVIHFISLNLLSISLDGREVDEVVLTMEGGPYQEYFYIQIPIGKEGRSRRYVGSFNLSPLLSSPSPCLPILYPPPPPTPWEIIIFSSTSINLYRENAEQYKTFQKYKIELKINLHLLINIDVCTGLCTCRKTQLKSFSCSSAHRLYQYESSLFFLPSYSYSYSSSVFFSFLLFSWLFFLFQCSTITFLVFLFLFLASFLI